MSEPKDGGPAFPATRKETHTVGMAGSDKTYISAVDVSYAGMSLRDYFAAKAMQQLVVTSPDAMNFHVQPSEALQDTVARLAYAMADAMLAARAAQEGASR